MRNNILQGVCIMNGTKLSVFSLLLILAFMGCDSPEEKGTGSVGKVTLKFWSFQPGTEAEFWAEAVQTFNGNHENIKIEHQVVSQSDYITTLIPTAYANGEAPDILFVEPSTFIKYAEREMLADLTVYYTDALKADMQPSALTASTFNGKILSLPFEMETLGLYYNADILRDAGINPPKTWTELYNAAKALTTDKMYGLVLPVEKSGYTLFNWWPFMWMNDADVLEDDRKGITVDSPEMAFALDYWGRFFTEGLAPNSLQIGPWDIGNIGTGIAAMQVGGTYMIVPAETVYSDVNIQVVPLPAPEGKSYKTVAGGQRLAVNSQSKNRDAAAEFIFWLFGSTDISMANRYVTKAKFAYPARFSVVEANKLMYNDGLRRNFTEFYDTAIPEPSYSAEITDIVGNMLQAVMFNGESGIRAAQKARQEMESSM
jgi:multiple sugar transport system substrate-binding protein